MKKIIITLGIVAAVIAVGVGFNSPQPNYSNNQMEATLQLSWIPSGSFTGDVVSLAKFDQDYNLELDAKFGGPGINTIQLVQAGDSDFGWLAADEVLAANEKGSDLIIIGVITNQSPGGFVTLSDNNIKTPKDFEGKTVGLLPFGNTAMLYEAMLLVNKVDRHMIKEPVISPDLKPFIKGDYDVHPVFLYDETVTLEQQGIKYNVIDPAEFGVDFKGPVYFTKRSTLENNPELVRAFINTMADGYNYAVKNPEEAVQTLKEYAPEIDYDRELSVFKKAIPYFSAYQNQPLNSDLSTWDSTAQILEQTGIIKPNTDIKNALDFSFINGYYEN